MISIREIIDADFEQVKSIISEVTSDWGNGWDDLVTKMFFDGKSTPFDVKKYVAIDNGEVLGILALKKEICASVIYFLAAKKGHRGKEIGSKLLEYAQEFAKRSKCYFLRVDVYYEYEKNKNFYIKNGFKESGEVENYYELGDRQIFFFKKIQ